MTLWHFESARTLIFDNWYAEEKVFTNVDKIRIYFKL